MKNLLFIILCGIMCACNPLEKITNKHKKEIEFQKIAFTGANILTMMNDSVQWNQTLLVENGKIIVYGDKNSVAVPADFHIVPCEGKFLMPGFTDMHVHISDDGDMLKFLKYGITTVRHMSDVPWWAKLMGFSDILSLREKQKNGKVFGPEIYTFGYSLDGKPPVSPLNKKITDANSAKKEIVREKKAGYDFLKLYDKLTLTAYNSIIESAKQVNMPVAGHVPDSVGIDRVLDDGIKSIEHLTGYLDNNTGDYIIPKDKFGFYINKTREKRVYNCPTLVVWENIPPETGFDIIKKDPDFKYLKWYVKWLWKTSLPYYYKNTYPDKAGYTKRMSDITREFTTMLYAGGCPLLIGTDANVIGTFIGKSTLKEMETFSKCGIPAYEILRSATVTAAEALGKDNEIGTIQKGKKANFILLNENPLVNINNINTLAFVFVNKFLFPKEFIDNMVDQYYKL